MTTTSLGTLIQEAIAAAKNDAIKVGLPVLGSFFTNIGSNPSVANVTVQLAALQVNLLAALPNLEQAVIKDIAALLQAEITSLASSATTA